MGASVERARAAGTLVGALEVAAHYNHRDPVAEEVGPGELAERDLRLAEAAGFAHRPGEVAIAVATKFVEARGQVCRAILRPLASYGCSQPSPAIERSARRGMSDRSPTTLTNTSSTSFCQSARLR